MAGGLSVTGVDAARPRHRSGALRRVLGAGGAAVLLSAALLAPMRTAKAQELVYFWEQGCPYCEMWDDDIGPIYGKTAEAERFPLRKEPLHDGIPDDLRIDRSVQFTPTFVLVDAEGREVGRVTGYHPEYFWAFLDQQIKAYDARLNDPENGTCPAERATC